jgi:hypothetical protein
MISEDPRAAVDKVLVRKVDVTGEWKPDTINLRVTGQLRHQPRWIIKSVTLTIGQGHF